MPKIIVIEDSTLIRKRILNVLHEYGFKNIVDYESADSIGNNPSMYLNGVDLIISDIRLPGMTGIELARMLSNNENYSKTPIIFLTSCSDTKTISEAVKAGGIDYIVKPFQDEILISKITKVLGEDCNNDEL